MKRIAIILATALAWEGCAFALLPAEASLSAAQSAATVLSLMAVTCFNLCVACRR